ncbi:GntR family transcriptional regulator [Solihabitans fulvus]|uniref:alpha-L-fucosidase n=1 Tax=Solihabitans fulvus TaxID=1892852 RepID=A0A5B2XAN7_9PSEU|nr:alpha-L-fucosidase [Solihabitans fulvus]KAA2260677.1 GntR family transcriptional regulator [Solihabitans fulvus]
MTAPGQPSPTTRPAVSWALEQLLGLLARGSYAPGQQLPVERDLALQLGVSRGSIREAMSALAALGLVDPRQGAGVFVTAVEPVQLLSGLRLVLPIADETWRAELLDVHAVLEAAAAARSAATSGPAEVARLTKLAGEVAAADTHADAAEADREFHRELTRHSGNAMLAALADALFSASARADLWRAAWEKGREHLLLDHDMMVSAVERQDADGARAWSLAHAARATAERRSLQPVLTARKQPQRVGVEPEPEARETPAWFRDAKLGVIVHWGLYSVPGWAPLDESLVDLLVDDESVPRSRDELDPLVTHSFSEWYENGISIEDSPTWHYHRATYGGMAYQNFRGPFASALEDWDPAEWADLFAAAGARYAVPVAKHHDGYRLWPSQVPHPHEWNAPRDVIGELADAVRQRSMRLGLYYSSGMDWSFANLPVRRMADTRTSCPPGPAYAAYVDAHWRELIENYRPDFLWNDMGYPGDPSQLVQDYYAAVPEGIINDRFWSGPYDVATPNFARRHEVDARAWEVARPIGLSFGWNRQEGPEHALSGTELVHLLLDVVSKNGNLLLGVSPDDRGRIPKLQQRALLELGRWLEVHGQAVYGTRPWTTPESATQDGLPVRFTTTTDALYAHFLGAAAGETVITGLHLPDGTRVTDLASGAPIRSAPGRRGTVLTLPATADPVARVVRISPIPSHSMHQE